MTEPFFFLNITAFVFSDGFTIEKPEDQREQILGRFLLFQQDFENPATECAWLLNKLSNMVIKLTSSFSKHFGHTSGKDRKTSIIYIHILLFCQPDCSWCDWQDKASCFVHWRRLLWLSSFLGSLAAETAAPEIKNEEMFSADNTTDLQTNLLRQDVTFFQRLYMKCYLKPKLNG